MKILVTGATGFLGQTLCRFLRQNGHELTELNSRHGDLTQPASLDRHARDRYDRIYHLAAWTQAGDFCLHHPGEQWIINQQINTHLLDWWQRCQRQARLICIGTSCAYDPELPLKEEHYLAGTPIASLFTYAMTKRMLLTGLMALRQQYGLDYLCVVPSTLYGPGYHTDGRQLHFIFDLIRKLLRGKYYGEPVILWGDGHQRRELVFVQDFVEVLWQLDARCGNTLVNIGAGEDYSIREFAQAICRRIDFDPEKIQYDATRYVGARSKKLCIDKLKSLIPELRLRPLAEGLAQTIDWFLAQKAHEITPSQGGSL
jgi:GDP-L-fucose synthase